MNSNSLEIKGLEVDRGGRPVLLGIDMSIAAGSITALLGANGAGKSSLIATLAGVIPARKGEISVNGKPLLGKKPSEVRRLGVAAAPEGHPVLSNMTVKENLYAAGLMHSKVDCDIEIENVLELLPELKPKLSIDAQNLSGGQKQMVNVAMALIARPKYLLIDELSFGLSPAVVGRLGETTKEIAARGVGVLLIEQFTTLALSLASKVYVMERGRIYFDGMSDEIKAKPEILHGAYLAGNAH